ncbi:MAG: hypothetical protein ACMXYB_00030 [Candidatus Woesearchaeota archaeon]
MKLIQSKVASYRTSRIINFLYVVLGVVFFIAIYGFHNDLIDRDTFTHLRFNVEQPPLNMSELREEIKFNIDNLNKVDENSFEVLATQLAKDSSNLYYIQSYENSGGDTLFTLTLLSLEFDIEFDSLQPIFSKNHDNLSISTQFFKDTNTIYFLHESMQYSYSNLIFEPLQNVSTNSWEIINSSTEFSSDENYIYYASKILKKITNSQEAQYFGDSYLYYDDIVYFKNIPLILKENISSFEIIDESFSYKILEIEDTIWIHPIYSARNIFLQNVSDASSFRFFGVYRENQRLFDSLGIGILHVLFEDSENYYSLQNSRVPMFGTNNVDYLEEMEIIELFEIHPKR